MYLIAGLGNPGLKYKHTRHNAGFDCLDILAKKHQISIKKKEHFSLTGRGKINGEPVVLLKPQTYMNSSGEAIQSMAKALEIDITTELIVLVDDINLDYGSIRIRPKGSAGGHNGLKSIISCVGTQEFARIRIGAGILPESADMIGHVLSVPGKKDRIKLQDAYENACEACELLLLGRMEKAMNLYNGRTSN